MVFKSKSLLVHFVMLFLLISSSYARLSMKISEDEVKTICSEASNPPFCYNFFRSTPQTKSLDLYGVGDLLINYGSSDAKDVRKQFKSLAKSATDPSYKMSYDECSGLYDDAVSDFNNALKSLAKKDYDSFNVQISAVITYGNTCKDDSSGPLTDPQLEKKISDINSVADILLVIWELLVKK